MSTRKWAEKGRGGYNVERRSVIKWDYETEACDYNRHRGENIVVKE